MRLSVDVEILHVYIQITAFPARAEIKQNILLWPRKYSSLPKKKSLHFPDMHVSDHVCNTMTCRLPCPNLHKYIASHCDHSKNCLHPYQIVNLRREPPCMRNDIQATHPILPQIIMIMMQTLQAAGSPVQPSHSLYETSHA